MTSPARKSIFSVWYPYVNPFDQQRAYGLLMLNYVLLAGALIWFGISLLPVLVEGAPFVIGDYFWVIFPAIIAAAVFTLVQTGRLRIAANIFVGLFVLIGVISLTSGVSSSVVVAGIVALIASSILLNQRGTLVVAIIIFVASLAGVLVQSQMTEAVTFVPADQIAADMPALWINLGLALALLYFFTGNIENIGERLLRDAQRLEQVADLQVQLAESSDENVILAQTIRRIVDNLGFAFASVYAYDESGTLMNRMRTDIGRQQTEGQERLNLNSASIISEAARRRRVIIAAAQDASERHPHFLPSTNFGAALPLLHRGVLIGVLDVQSAQATPFTENDLIALNLLANDLAAQLDFVRIIDDLQTNLRQQENLNASLQEQIAELRENSQRSASGDWGNYLRGRGASVLGYDMRPGQAVPIPADDLPSAIRPALEKGELVVENTGDEQIINIPITFRGEILGAMAFAVPQGEQVSERQLEMARNVSNRLALALENARLFEQTQAQALRERRASEISSLLIGATDVETVLNLAAENFNEALGAVYTRVYLQPRALAEPGQVVKE
jgi:GAF domain-containing protein